MQETNWYHAKTDLNLAIPDSDANGVTDTINVNNDLIIEAVQVKITLDHTYSGDIGIELTSPSGMKSTLMNINSNILETNLTDALLLSNAFYGENAQGTWTLKIIDGAPLDTGVLKGWKLNLYGHNPTNLNLLTKSNTLRNTVNQNNRNLSSSEDEKKVIELSTNIIRNTVTGAKFEKVNLKTETKIIKFNLILKNKIENYEHHNEAKIIDHDIDEDGRIIYLKVKDGLSYINEKKLDYTTSKILDYRNSEEYILAQEKIYTQRTINGTLATKKERPILSVVRKSL